MRAPKILPWIAHKAGINEDLALNLWRRAAGEAEEMTGCCDSPDYYRLAVERFIDLAQDEGEKCAPIAPLSTPRIAADLGWFWRHQNRIAQLNLLAAQNAYRLWQKSWSNFVAGQKQLA